MVPRTRLLYWTACALPFTLMRSAAGSSEAHALMVLSALFIIAAVAVVDALAARSRLAGISLSLPKRLRMIRDREASLPVAVLNSGGRPLALRIGLPLPAGFSSQFEDRLVALPSDRERSTVPWPITAPQRGRYAIDRCHFETPSPLGLWSVRGSSPAETEVRVYPNLRKEHRDLAPLFLKTGALGIHSMRMVGRGREFDKLRDYVPGDAYDEIHWKATARRHRPITKVYRMERTQEVYVVIDASRLAARAIGAEPTLERFLTAALIIGQAAEHQGDHYGILAHSDSIHRFIRASSGRDHYSACRDALYDLESRLVTPDFGEVASFIRVKLRRRALLIFLTELDDPVISEQFLRHTALFSRKHLAIVLAIRPTILQPLFTGAPATEPDEIYTRLGGHMLWHNLRETETTLSRHGVSFTAVEDARLSVEAVSQYIRIKRRQLL